MPMPMPVPMPTPVPPRTEFHLATGSEDTGVDSRQGRALLLSCCVGADAALHRAGAGCALWISSHQRAIQVLDWDR